MLGGAIVEGAFGAIARGSYNGNVQAKNLMAKAVFLELNLRPWEP